MASALPTIKSHHDKQVGVKEQTKVKKALIENILPFHSSPKPGGLRLRLLFKAAIITSTLLTFTLMLFVQTQTIKSLSPPKSQPHSTPNLLINLTDFHFVIKPSTKTQDKNYNAKLLFIINSGPRNVQKRNAIRNTWGSIKFLLGWQIRKVFIIGQPFKPKDQKSLLKEAQQFNDIVQGSFVDAYRNLTYKSIMGMKYASQYFPNSSFVLKMDDDVYVDIPQVVKLIDSHKQKQRIIIGRIPGLRNPMRDESSKWYVSHEQYSPSEYPVYLSGMAYIMSRDVLEPLILASQDVPYFWFDDVYITGSLREYIEAKYPIQLIDIGRKYVLSKSTEIVQLVTQEDGTSGNQSHVHSKNQSSLLTTGTRRKLPFYFIHCTGNCAGDFKQIWTRFK